MAEKPTPQVSKEDVLFVTLMRKQLQGLTKASAAFDKQRKKEIKTAKAWAKGIKDSTKPLKDMVRFQKEVAKAQKSSAAAMAKTTKQMRQQFRETRKLNREMKRTARVSQAAKRGITGLGSSFGSLVGLATSAATALALIQRAKNVARASIDTRVLGGVGLSRSLEGVTDPRDAARLLQTFAGQGIAQFAELQEGLGSDLLKFREQFVKLGPETASALTQSLAKTFDPHILREFLAEFERNQTDALSRFENIRTFETTQQIRNALQLAQGQNVSPAEQGALAVIDSMNSLNNSLDSLSTSMVDVLAPALTKVAEEVKTWAERISKMSPEAQAAIGGAAVATGAGAGILSSIGPFLASLIGTKLGLRGLVGKLPKGAPVPSTGIPKILGFGRAAQTATTATTAARSAGIGARILTALVALPETLGFLLATNATAASVAGGAILAAPIAVGGAVIADAQFDREKAIGQKFEGFQSLQQQLGEMGQRARDAQRNAPDELTRLRGKRLEIERHIIASDPDDRNLGRLRTMRKEVVAEIKELRETTKAMAEAVQATNETSPFEKTKDSEALKKAAESIKDASDSSKSAFADAAKRMEHAADSLRASSGSVSIADSIQRIHMLGLDATIAGQQSTLRQLELQRARTNVLGISPFSKTQDAIRAVEQQIEIQSEILAETLKTMQTIGPREQILLNEIRIQIERMRGEAKRLGLDYIRQLQQSIIGDAVARGAGRFEKILITQQRNLGMGVLKHIANAHPRIVGSQQGFHTTGRTPRILHPSGMVTPLPPPPFLTPQPQPKPKKKPKPQAPLPVEPEMGPPFATPPPIPAPPPIPFIEQPPQATEPELPSQPTSPFILPPPPQVAPPPPQVTPMLGPPADPSIPPSKIIIIPPPVVAAPPMLLTPPVVQAPPLEMMGPPAPQPEIVQAPKRKDSVRKESSMRIRNNNMTRNPAGETIQDAGALLAKSAELQTQATLLQAQAGQALAKSAPQNKRLTNVNRHTSMPRST